MQAVVKKVVYSFRYRLGPGQVGKEVFHKVLNSSRSFKFPLNIISDCFVFSGLRVLTQAMFAPTLLRGDVHT